MQDHYLLLNKEIVLTDWAWAGQNRPSCVVATIVEYLGDDDYLINLAVPITFPDGSAYGRLIISSRHVGYTIIKISPGFLNKLFIFKHPLVRLFIPLVAVNVSTEDSKNGSIACVYLKSVYLKSGGKIL